jgi:hypothetical protein
MSLFDYHRISFRAKFYYALRIYLHKSRGLLRFVQILRVYIIRGPFRTPIVRYYQKFSHHKLLQINRHPIFPHVDADQILKNLRDMGYVHAGTVPEEYISQIFDYCAMHKQPRYWNPHHTCEAVNRICRNATVVDIARRYLGAEPILWLTVGPENSSRR